MVTIGQNQYDSNLEKLTAILKTLLSKLMKMESFFKVIYQNTLQNFLSRSHSRRDSTR